MVDPTTIFKSRSKPRKITTTYIEKDKTKVTLDWIIKPLSPRLMVRNYKYFAALEEMDKDKVKGQELTKDEEIETLEKLAPLIDVILPFSCVKPKVVENEETVPGKQINIDDLDIQTLMELFSEIFKASGVSEEADKDRKNLEKPLLPKPSQPSV